MTSRVDQVVAGNIRVAARVMRDIDDRQPAAMEELKELYRRQGGAYVVGITGNPGAGKSTVVDSMIAAYRAAGKRVGVVAVDPTSPFSGGAILGDRIRMQRHALDEGVFIRSLATRGQLGGLSRSTFDVVTVLNAMNYDVILVETVGVGQDEIEVMRIAHTSVVVTVPGLGDDIQAIKAGLLEVADILVVNKSDREGADRTVTDLTHMLDLRAHNRDIQIIKTVAIRGEGIERLVDTIDRHREDNWQGPSAERGERQRASAYIRDLLKSMLTEQAESLLNTDGLEGYAAAVVRRETDPYTAATQILATKKAT